jgi:hypothetical protein
MAIERASEFGDFQAEYEGSIPFTLSKTILMDLPGILNLRYDAIPTILTRDG